MPDMARRANARPSTSLNISRSSVAAIEGLFQPTKGHRFLSACDSGYLAAY
jgi:hypothetical protein